MLSRATSTPLDDIEFLARSDHRVTALVALASRPRDRPELLEITGASTSTIGRTLREFENRRWVRREGHRFEATQLGRFVASGIEELMGRIETVNDLRDVWKWLPTEESGFTVEMGSSAVVTEATVDEPYGPVNRFISLLRGTDRFRFAGYDVALLEPCKDEFRRRILDGMRTEIIDPPSVATYILTRYEAHCADPLKRADLTVRVHDDLPPYGICLFDDRMAISGYNPDNGAVQVLLDTDDPDAREWAESTYDSSRREARRLDFESTVE